MKQSKPLYSSVFFVYFFFLLTSSTNVLGGPSVTNPNPTDAPFFKGADISWQTEQMASGYSWKDKSGNEMPLHNILKGYSMNAVRLRVWVNPVNGWNAQEDVIRKAHWAKNANMDIMITLHYSDTWADPGHQTKPAAWASMTVEELEHRVGTYTNEILEALKVEGITPKWVQIGNETSNGMLWPEGKASTHGFTNYHKFLQAGLFEAKKVFPNIKTIIHLANAENLPRLEWNLDGLLASGECENEAIPCWKDQWDILGLSLYPKHDSVNDDINAYENNLGYLKNKYGKDVMLVEVGMPAAPISNAYSALYDILNRTRNKGGLGVFYWEPQGYNNWNGYSKHAWHWDGHPTNANQPTWALDAFIWGGN